MSVDSLLQGAPFGDRDDAELLDELNALTRWHLDGCPGYRAVWPQFDCARSFDELPYLHVGTFKHRDWRTAGPGLTHQRTLTSSSTTGIASRVVLDAKSGALQSASTASILRAMIGGEQRPLVILDHATALRQRGEVSARVTAALALQPLASSIHFVGGEPIDWQQVVAACRASERVIVYGITWLLWTAWGAADLPNEVRAMLSTRQVQFVHSGGWKRLERLEVGREQFDQALLAIAGPGSSVLDFYGLAEQVGVIYPLCGAGFRHVPRWAAVVVRDPWTQQPLLRQPGMLQLLNPLAWGAPYHSVLTEDLGRVVDGPCPCGFGGQRFELLGRLPRAEVRGCGNV
ncbi:MAG TPA: hypothetical protein VEC39_14200 [Vicinamibacterales bacterium]|nr:hypothetical protein [Vicinamibacterales bacterium]